MAPSINRTDQGLRLWYSFPRGTTYLLAQNVGWDQWTVIVLQGTSKKKVRYSVDEFIPWVEGSHGGILGPLIINTVEQLLQSPQPNSDILMMDNWYAFWLPENTQKASVAIYYDPERRLKKIDKHLFEWYIKKIFDMGQKKYHG